MAENSTRYGIEIGKDIAEQIRIAAEKTGCDPQAYATAALKAGLETLTAEQSHQTRRASTARARAKNPRAAAEADRASEARSDTQSPFTAERTAVNNDVELPMTAAIQRGRALGIRLISRRG